MRFKKNEECCSFCYRTFWPVQIQNQIQIWTGRKNSSTGLLTAVVLSIQNAFFRSKANQYALSNTKTIPNCCFQKLRFIDDESFRTILKSLSKLFSIKNTGFKKYFLLKQGTYFLNLCQIFVGSCNHYRRFLKYENLSQDFFYFECYYCEWTELWIGQNPYTDLHRVSHLSMKRLSKCTKK